jgi:hypothetical protein
VRTEQIHTPRSPARRGTSRHGLGGATGNEVLTSAAAIILTGLLIAEGVTIIDMGGLSREHMFIGMALIPPVMLKLGSTGYRFIRYYTRSRAYRAKGPPALPLRLLAPVLVATTIAVFATGVLLVADGHKAGSLLEAHKISFIVWGVVFAVHFLAYAARAMRTVVADWGGARRAAVPGAGLRSLLVAAAVGAGAVLAIALLPEIGQWHA